jgi:hypothetical protein
MANYVQISGPLQTNSANWTPMTGLTLTIPEGVGTEAIIILCVPIPWATGNNYPGGNFGIAVNGQVLPMYGCFTYDSQTPQSTGRKPTTVVVGVPLGQKPQQVQAMWSGVRGSTVHIDSPASMTMNMD